MNGINYSTLLDNTGFFSNQTKKVTDEITYKGASFKTKEKKQSNADQDTVEINGKSREIPKAGYDRPKRVEKQDTEYKKIDENGIQEGVELSDAARNLLEELRKKYTKMDIYAASWSTDEEQDYYAGLGRKEYSVLIAPEALEAMAADESVREQYEAVLGGAEEKYNTLEEQLGEDADKIKNFSITIDQDGKVSYAVKLIQDFEEKNTKRAEESRKAAEEKRAEKKAAEKKKAEKTRTEKIEADSIEDLVTAIQEKLHPQENEDVEE